MTPARTRHAEFAACSRMSFEPVHQHIPLNGTQKSGLGYHSTLTFWLAFRSIGEWAVVMRPIRLLLAVAFPLACFVCQVNAQTTTSGSLAGVVTDPTHAVVPDTTLVIKDSGRGTTQSTKTDREGAYRFFFLAPGRYALTVTHDGFQDEKRSVDVLLGPPVSVNITLAIAKARDIITVSDEVPLIQAENGDVSATMNQKQISEVPNPGNDLTNIVQVAPGTVMNTDNNFGAAFSILGMPGDSYLYTINGMSDNDNGANLQLVGSLFLLLGQNQIEEATVVTTGYSGQFGGAAGGNINYITKSGSNQFHGNAQYYWNGSVLNANDWFIKATGGSRPFDITNQWAGSIGGPIKKGKLFFFFDNEGLRVIVPQLFFDIQAPSPQFEAATMANIDSIFGIGSASEVFYKKVFRLYDAASTANSATIGVYGDPLGCSGFTGLGSNVPCSVHFNVTRGRPSQDMLNSGRLDWNISNHDRAFLRVQYDGGHSAVGLDPISPVFDGDVSIPWWQGQLVETHSLGSSGASQFLVAGSSSFAFWRMLHPTEALSAMPVGFSFSSGFNQLGGNNSNLNPLGTVYGMPLRYQLSEDIVKTLQNHKLGFGVNAEVIHWDVWEYSLNVIGRLNVQTLDAFYHGGVDPSSPTVDFTILNQSFPRSLSQRMAFHNFAGYAQDEWHARRSLSLTLGVRAEHQSNPSCERACFARLAGPFESLSHDPNQPYNQAILTNQKQAFSGMDKVLWSPRFSFAWQPLGVSHATVLRGGIGIFYDPLPGSFAFNLSSNPPILNSYTVAGDNLAPGERTNLFNDADASNKAFVNGFNTGQTLAQIQKIFPGFSPPAITSTDGVTHSPQYQKWSLELQQAFGVHSAANLGYFGYHGIHGLVQNPSANAFGFGSLPAAVCTSPPVPPCADPRFSEVTTLSSGAVSNYNGMVASFRHAFSRWTSGLFQINYTFGHALDEVSNGGLFSFTGSSTIFPQDAKDLRRSYGPAEYDVRHSLNANYVWEVPTKTLFAGHGPDSLLRGWQVSGTVFFHEGFPYSVFDNFQAGILQQYNYFGPVYAVPVGPLGPDPRCGEGAAFTNPVYPCEPAQVLINNDGTTTPNPNARFVQAGCETGFDVGKLGPFPACNNGQAVAFVQSRNRFRGPSYFNNDFTLMKNTKLAGWENASLAIGFQFFNLFNHPNFSNPVNNIQDPEFGWIFGQDAPYTSLMGNNTGGDSARRLIQIKAELKF
jgi:hypothetical protein